VEPRNPGSGKRIHHGRGVWNDSRANRAATANRPQRRAGAAVNARTANGNAVTNLNAVTACCGAQGASFEGQRLVRSATVWNRPEAYRAEGVVMGYALRKRCPRYARVAKRT